MPKTVQKPTNRVNGLGSPSNDAAETIGLSEPYRVSVEVTGVSDLLFHRWSCDSVKAKADAAKGSAAKKTDDLESYVYRLKEEDPASPLGLPGEYLRMSLVHAAKFKQDPRSPRKSAMDLYKAGVISLTNLASLGQCQWDYLDRRRVVIQRNGVTRVRPAMRAGWKAEIILLCNLPEYISQDDLSDTLSQAGKLIGLGDFRPSFGRFRVSKFAPLED